MFVWMNKSISMQIRKWMIEYFGLVVLLWSCLVLHDGSRRNESLKLARIVAAALATKQYLTTVAGQINWCLWNKVQSVHDIHPTTDHSLSPHHTNCDCTVQTQKINLGCVCGVFLFFPAHCQTQIQKTLKKKSMISNWLEFVSHLWVLILKHECACRLHPLPGFMRMAELLLLLAHIEKSSNLSISYRSNIDIILQI